MRPASTLRATGRLRQGFASYRASCAVYFFLVFSGPRRRAITPDGGEPELTRAALLRLRWWWARGSHAEALENGLLFNKR